MLFNLSLYLIFVKVKLFLYTGDSPNNDYVFLNILLFSNSFVQILNMPTLMCQQS